MIGGAWPYANGSLHLGHIAALLPGDILARYYRQKGEKVLYVSGSDCNGTPISIRANQEQTTVNAIADRYHKEFEQVFQQLGFSYDIYTRTDASHHHQTVQTIFLTLLENGYLYKKKTDQAYCEYDGRFLPDRFVEAICPNCGEKARGDQCDHCSAILDPLELIDKRCKICGQEPVVKETEHFYLSFSTLQEKLEKYTAGAEQEKRWRENAIALTKRYLAEGIQDRAVTRDLPNGVDVPIEGFEGKKIYVWIEAVSGYLSASIQWAKQNGENIHDWWNQETVAYYIHGKDNIPFHTIIWPAILLGINTLPLPTYILSNEYLTLEKRKLSTSQNWAVWLPEILSNYNPDSIRYFLTMNAPENRDTDFSWREFIYSHNSELLGAFGNFVNRTLKFIEKSFESTIPQGVIDEQMEGDTEKTYDVVGTLIERGQMKKALETNFEYIRKANKYFDEQKPWILVKEDVDKCKNVLATCTFIIQNLAQLLEPFLPFATKQVKEILKIKENTWTIQRHLPTKLGDVYPLFEQIDVNQIDKEIEKLYGRSITT